jgi:hypothetical protein
VAPAVASSAPAINAPPARVQLKVPSKAASKAPSPPKEAKKSTPKPKGKAPADDFDLGLDTSILEEAPQYTSTAKVVPPVGDPSIMAPPMDVFDDSPKAPKAVQQPRIMPPPPPSPIAATADLQKEYIAALHQRTATSRPKVTYTSSNKSIKRKSEEESPEQAQARKMKKEPVDGQTTFENLRQLSLGLRVRGQRGGEVC